MIEAPSTLGENTAAETDSQPREAAGRSGAMLQALDAAFPN